jgi:hypothetical protein
MSVVPFTHFPNANFRQHIKKRICQEIQLQKAKNCLDDLEEDLEDSDLRFFFANLDFPLAEKREE